MNENPVISRLSGSRLKAGMTVVLSLNKCHSILSSELRPHPTNWNHATLASAFAGLVQMGEARKALREAYMVKSDLSISYLQKMFPARLRDGREQYLSDMRKTGQPE